VSGGEPRHLGRRLLRLTPELVVLLVLAVAFASFEYDVARRLGWDHTPEDPAQIEPPSGLVLPELVGTAPVAEPAAPGGILPREVRAALAPYLRDRDLGRRVVAAVATADGELLFEDGSGAVTPASTTKLLTAAAALGSIGPDARFVTSVVPGARRGEIVLVGGGDPYLVRRDSRDDYPEAADLRTLARDTAAALGATRRVRLAFDDSLFSGPAFSPAWPRDYERDAVVAPIGALWVDQGVDRTGFGFETDPALAAAELFVAELARAGVTVAGAPLRAEVDPSTSPLAVVESPPVWQIAERVLLVSDNEGAEVLARHVAIEEGFPGSFAGATRGIEKALADLGITLRGGDVVHDGSGLSRRDRLTPATLLDVLMLAASDSQPELHILASGLPVAGFTGSLSERFVDGPDAGPGRVRAKTGTLTGVHGLAGVATTESGEVLLFVLLADRVRVEDTLDARKTLDDMAAALAGLGS
jgi:D-alanyl-D-alanine carboxypeptidase/D-alanyl-D-alanine-endopeptidase (penicillin-binding protein 4)